MEKTGELVSHYRIVRRIGRGGMGEVFEAEDETLRRRVALKSIRAEDRPSPREKARFLREARILSQLDHPGICRIHDYLDGDDRDHLVLELIQGQTIEEGEFEHPLELIEQLLQVLVVAHDADIIHRDLKPANVMVTPDGVVKVLDFGLARQLSTVGAEAITVALSGGTAQATSQLEETLLRTRGNGIVGTPSFMSPEQASGESATAASDMYSCGLVIHYLLAGESAYGQSRHLPELLGRVRNAETTRLKGVDKDIATLVAQMTRRAPGARPTAAEALRRLHWIRTKPARRNRRLLAALVILLALGGGLKYTLDVRHERQAADKSRAQAEDLLSFMLGDLRAKLTPISRLDIMDAVGGKALDYFSGRDAAELSDDDADRYIRTLNLIGQIRLTEGRLPAARAAFTEALTTAEDLVAREPDNAEWQIQLGATRFYLGSVAYSNGDLTRAETQFRHYYRISQALVDRNSNNPVWRQELAYAQTTLAQLFKDQHKRDQAVLMLDEALVSKQWLVDQDPTVLDPIQDLANSQAIYGSILEDAGHLQGALSMFHEARRNIAGIVRRDSLNFAYKSRLAVLLQREGKIHELLGHNEIALDFYQRDLALGRMLAVHDPANLRWQNELATSLYTTGSLFTGLGQFDRADRLLTEAETLVTNMSSATTRTRAERTVRRRRASFHFAQGNFAQTLLTLQPDTVAAPRTEARLYLTRGKSLAALNRQAEARSAWSAGLRLIAGVDRSALKLSDISVWTQLCVLTGDLERAQTLTTELKEAGYARFSYRQFCQSHKWDIN